MERFENLWLNGINAITTKAIDYDSLVGPMGAESSANCLIHFQGLYKEPFYLASYQWRAFLCHVQFFVKHSLHFQAQTSG